MKQSGAMSNRITVDTVSRFPRAVGKAIAQRVGDHHQEPIRLAASLTRRIS
ncbi:hypothetical protein EDD30_0688 [Couchioplanes caeruleus]|uniref:Uncharacterized protein n=1 Tax=Couchioplanes caeruleus TaxID=56438 RepID=A0A3N1GCX1_9ACTN|nr:hypothetical protein EDD30_0688 [Couchioplanes caeruleus]